MKKITALLIAFSLLALPKIFCDTNALLEKAIKGDSNAQLELGKYYEKKGYKALMTHWYERAAEHNDVIAQEYFAQKFFNNGDIEKAVNLAQKLADQGNEVGKSILSYYYCWGVYGVPINKSLSLKLAQESSNVPLSKAVLANFYFNGFWGIKKDYDKAVKLAEDSLNEGCAEGGCIRLRIANLSHKIDKNHNLEIEKIMENSDYVDSILNTAISKVSSSSYDYNSVRKMIEPYLGKNYATPYYMMAILEQKCHNMPKAKEYINKAAQLWNDDSIFEEFCNFISLKDFENAKKMAFLAFKTQNPKLIAQLYFLFNEAKDKKRVSNKALPVNTDWAKLIKIGADNGHPVLMLLHAKNIGKDDKDYQKYLNQAKEMGVSRVLVDCYDNCKDLKKWLEIGAELQDIKSMELLGSTLIDLKRNPFIKLSSDYINLENDGIKYLEYAAKHGDKKSTEELLEYFLEPIKGNLSSNSRLASIFFGKKEVRNKEANEIIKRSEDSHIIPPEKQINFEQTFIWSKIIGQQQRRTEQLFENISKYFTEAQIKELDKKVDLLKEEINKNIEEDKRNKILQKEYYIHISEMEFVTK